MALLYRENSCGRGGSQENLPSLAEIRNLDASPSSVDSAAPIANLPESQEFGGWRRERSPEAAQSPEALVPALCFPPRGDSAAFTSFSELTRPGSCSSTPHEGIVDLVGTFKTLAVSTRPRHYAAPTRDQSIQTRLNCSLTLEASWPPEGMFTQSEEYNRALSRCASYCGAEERGRVSMLTWSGVLPPRCMNKYPPGGFSPKVFLGGLPWEFNKDKLMYDLRMFQPVHVEWPGRHNATRGCAYVTLKSESRVRALLAASRLDGSKWLYSVTVPHTTSRKDVEVIPWAVADSTWMRDEAAPIRLEASRTVFLGALHGFLSASALAHIMNDLFSGVVYVGIDTEKNKYPIGSGRVTFDSVDSYVRAVSAGYVEIRTSKFIKKIQMQPYLEDSMCSVCNLLQGPYFCREPVCFRYFCRSCWVLQHPSENHKVLTRHGNSVIFSNGNGSSNDSRSSNNQQQFAGEMCNGIFTQTRAIPSPTTSGGSLAPDWAP